MEKPKNREILQLHYRHKEEKLRERLLAKAREEKMLAKEMERLAEENRENFVFRLADNSFPASECDASETVDTKELPPLFQKFDYPVNDLELAEFKRQLNEKSMEVIKMDKGPAKFYRANVNDVEVGISCGDKVRSSVALQDFHDRHSEEQPRGKTNNHRSKGTNISTCLTHKEWLDSLANDPEILVSLQLTSSERNFSINEISFPFKPTQRKPPRVGRVLSTFKVERKPNDDKLLLFDDWKIKKNNIVGSIRQHIRETDEKLRVKNCQTNLKKSRSHVSCNDMFSGNHDSKRNQRMKFMGIPVLQSSRTQAKVSQVELRTIVASVSPTSILSREIPSNNKSRSKREQSNTRLALEDVKLLTMLPNCDYAIKGEREHLRPDRFPLVTKAQPRGSDARNLRADKSLPWIEDELNATRAKISAKLEQDLKNEKSFTSWITDTVARRVHSERKNAESETELSELKKSYNGIIAAKLQALIVSAADSVQESIVLEDDIQSTVDMSSSLSSTGTYFSNDSGSFVLELGRKIPISEMNLKTCLENKFQVGWSGWSNENIFLTEFFYRTKAW